MNPHIGAITKGTSIKGLSDLFQKFWEIEEVFQERKRTVEEEFCEEIFVKQHSRDSHGRYMVRMPFVRVLPEGKGKT